MATSGCGGALSAQSSHAREPRLSVHELDAGENAVAVAVDTRALPGAEVVLAPLVRARLQAAAATAGFDAARVESAIGAGAYRVRLALAPGQVEAAAKALRAALLDPLTAKEIESLRNKPAAFASWPVAGPASAAAAACQGRFHRREGDRLDTQTLREPGSSVHAADTVSIAFAGAKSAAARFHRSLRAQDWPTGKPRLPAPTASAQAWVLEAEPSRNGGPVLHLLRHDTAVERSLALGRALAEPGVLRGAVLADGDGARIDAIEATADPAGGGCVSVSVAWNEPVGAAALASTAARLEARLRSAADSLPPAARGLGAHSAVDLAERAAYLGLAERSAGRAETRYAVRWPQRHGEPALPTPEAMQSALDAARAPDDTGNGDTSSLRFAGRSLRGQPESWLLLASPCGVQGESASDAGASAAYVMAVAARAAELSSARAEPWIEADRVGVLLHDAPRRGESASDLASRLGSAAARAWLGDGLALDAAMARLDALDTAGRAAAAFAPTHPGALPLLLPSRPIAFAEGDGHAALAFGDALLAPLRPLGSLRSRQALSASVIGRRGESLVQSTSIASYLASGGKDELGRARSTLHGALPRGNGSCPARSAPTPDAVSGGRLLRVPRAGDARTATSQVPALFVLKVPVATSELELTTLVDYLGQLAPEAVQGLARTVTAERWGQGEARLLVLRVEATPALAERTVQQLRAFLAAQSSGHDSARWTQAAQRARAALAAQRADVRFTLAEQWDAAAARKTTPAPATAQVSSRVLALLADPNLTVIVREP